MWFDLILFFILLVCKVFILKLLLSGGIIIVKESQVEELKTRVP